MSSRTQPPRRATGCRALTQAATTTPRHTTKPTAPDPPPSEASNPTHDDPLESDYESAASEGTPDNDAAAACDSADDASPPVTRGARRAALRAAVAIAKPEDASPPSVTHTRRAGLRAAVAIAKPDAATNKLPAKRATKGNTPPAGIKAEASAELQRDGQRAGGMVDASTGTVAEPRVEATAIVVDGYGLEVPADPVECFNVLRREVIAAYRAVEARRGSGRDLAVAMGTAAMGGSVGGGGGGKRAGAWEGGEGGGKRWRVKIGGGGVGGRAAEEGDGGGGGEFEGIYYISKE